MHHSSRSACLLALVLLATPGLAQDSQAQVLNPEFSDLSERWRKALEDLQVPGMAVAIVEGDTILHLETMGIRNPETQAPVDPDTMFYIASATKPFVAMALLQCVDEGKLDLDQPIKQYLSRFELADPVATAKITARDLLCHRPGLNSFPIVFLDAYSGGITDERYFHFMSLIEPTGEVTYTNVHLTLAGHLLQALDGKPWKESLRERIFEPMGMGHTTGYATWMYAQDNVAIPTALGEHGFEPAAVRKTDETMHAAGGLGTSVSDAARWLQLNLGAGELNGKRLVSEGQMTEMFKLQSEANRGGGIDGFGLGWMYGTLHGEVLMQHGGGYVGAASHFSFMPSTGLGVVVLANSGQAGSLLTEVVRADIYAHLMVVDLGRDTLPRLIKEMQQRREREASAPSQGENPARMDSGLSLDGASYAGLYRDEHWGDLKLAWDGEQLLARMGNVTPSLHGRGLDRFLCYAEGLVEWELTARIEGGRVESLGDGDLLTFRRVR